MRLIACSWMKEGLPAVVGSAVHNLCLQTMRSRTSDCTRVYQSQFSLRYLQVSLRVASVCLWVCCGTDVRFSVSSRAERVYCLFSSLSGLNVHGTQRASLCLSRLRHTLNEESAHL